LRKIFEKNVRKSGRQSTEKKTACDKRVSRETTIVLLALACQKLESSQKKYHIGAGSRRRNFSTGCAMQRPGKQGNAQVAAQFAVNEGCNHGNTCGD
jgi:hypothetical protein